MRSNKFWKISWLFLAVLSPTLASAQSHWIFLADKCAAEQDYFDAPLCADYLDVLDEHGVSTAQQSRWLNAISIPADQVETALQFPFVVHVSRAGSYQIQEEALAEDFAYGAGDWPTDMIRLDSLHRLGYTGKGVTIGVFDGGFRNLDSIAGFDSLRTQGRLIAHRDFSLNKPLGFNQSAHGMQVMSIMAAHQEDSIIGTAPHANYILARTEVSGSETHQEEFNWINAMEWADSIGVDIIHSSLGYSLFDSLQGDYAYADMDGETTIITIAAELAASRGILISNSAGNSGNDPWFYITAPCDGPNVLCVGAVDSFRNKPLFSSFGPSSDGRVKPDVMALGVRNTIYTPEGNLRTGSGTSFSGPVIAGAVACLMQAHPNRSAREIMDAVIQSADRYQNPDSAYGFGIPDMVKADSLLRITLSRSQPMPLSLKVYPNPSSDIVRIQCSPGSNYQLLSTDGQIIDEGKLANVLNFYPLDHLASGTYILRIEYRGAYAATSIIKY